MEAAVHKTKLISEQDLTDHDNLSNLSPCAQLKSVEFHIDDDIFEDILFSDHNGDIEEDVFCLDNQCLNHIYNYQNKLNNELRDLKTINHLLSNSEETKIIIAALQWLADDQQLSGDINKYLTTRNVLVNRESELLKKIELLSKKIPYVACEKSDFHEEIESLRRRACDMVKLYRRI